MNNPAPQVTLWNRWISWTLLCTFSILQFVVQNTVGIASIQLKVDLQADAALLSLLSSAFYFSYIPMQIFAGILFDRFGLKMVSIIAILGSGLGCLLFSISNSPELCLLARVLTGVACSFGFVGSLLATQVMFSIRQFALISAASETLSMVGAAGVNTALSWVALNYGWKSMYHACAATFVALAFAIVVLVHKKYPPLEGASSEQPNSDLKKILLDFRQLLANRNIWIAGITGAFTFSIVTVFAALWAIPYIQERFKIDQLEATSAVQLLYLGIGVASPLLGWLVTRISCKIVTAWGTLITMLCFYYLISDFATDWVMFCGALFVLGGACSVYHISFVVVANEVEAGIQGSAMGLTNLLLMTSTPLMQMLVGFLLSATEGPGVLDSFETYTVKDYQQALLVLVIGLAVSFVLLFAYKIDAGPKTTSGAGSAAG